MKDWESTEFKNHFIKSCLLIMSCDLECEISVSSDIKIDFIHNCDCIEVLLMNTIYLNCHVCLSIIPLNLWPDVQNSICPVTSISLRIVQWHRALTSIVPETFQHILMKENLIHLWLMSSLCPVCNFKSRNWITCTIWTSYKQSI